MVEIIPWLTIYMTRLIKMTSIVISARKTLGNHVAANMVF